jgi:hypothetical protein
MSASDPRAGPRQRPRASGWPQQVATRTVLHRIAVGHYRDRSGPVPPSGPDSAGRCITSWRVAYCVRLRPRTSSARTKAPAAGPADSPRSLRGPESPQSLTQVERSAGSPMRPGAPCSAPLAQSHATVRAGPEDWRMLQQRFTSAQSRLDVDLVSARPGVERCAGFPEHVKTHLERHPRRFLTHRTLGRVNSIAARGRSTWLMSRRTWMSSVGRSCRGFRTRWRGMFRPFSR